MGIPSTPYMVNMEIKLMPTALALAALMAVCDRAAGDDGTDSDTEPDVNPFTGLFHLYVNGLLCFIGFAVVAAMVVTGFCGMCGMCKVYERPTGMNMVLAMSAVAVAAAGYLLAFHHLFRVNDKQNCAIGTTTES